VFQGRGAAGVFRLLYQHTGLVERGLHQASNWQQLHGLSRLEWLRVSTPRLPDLSTPRNLHTPRFLQLRASDLDVGGACLLQDTQVQTEN